MVIHWLCCWSQSDPGSGPRHFTADRVVNYLLQWRSKVTETAHKFSAQQFKGQPTANCCSAQPTEDLFVVLFLGGGTTGTAATVNS